MPTNRLNGTHKPKQKQYKKPADRSWVEKLPTPEELTADEYTVSQIMRFVGKSRARIDQICREYEIGFLEDVYNNGALTRIISKDEAVRLIEVVKTTGKRQTRGRETAKEPGKYINPLPG